MIDLQGADGLLLVGDSERSADLYWATGFRAPDSFTYLWTPARSYLVIGELEIDRARSQARVDEVLSAAAWARRAAARHPEDEGPDRGRRALALGLAELGLRRLRVPAEFPLGLADFLRATGVELQVAPTPLFPQRALKTPAEEAAIAVAMAAAEAAMAAAAEALRRAAVRGGALLLDGEP
ncbi:MAG: aminopeptidase P family protein, partial [Gemmatimonadota bacterium]